MNNEVQDIEVLRKKAVTTTIIGTVIGVIVSGGLFLLILIFSPNGIDFLSRNTVSLFVYLFVLGAIIQVCIAYKPQSQFKKAYKQGIVLGALQKVFTDITYDFERGIEKKVISDTKMIHMGNHYRANDYVKGKYKDIGFEMSDVEIEEDQGKDTVTLFSGQWFIFDFNKSFKADIQVRDIGFSSASVSWGQFQEVTLEDVQFHRMFWVYAKNQLDAFYVLTPQVMERMKKLKDMIDGNLLFCFIDNRLHIAVENNKDLFEPSFYKMATLEQDQKKAFDEMKIITEFIDVLQLDNTLFKKNN